MSIQFEPRILESLERAGRSLILCLDDDIAVLSALRRLLRDEPYEVATASSPAQALSLLRRRTPDVIVSDERMSEASGTEFLAEVYERWPRIGRVLLTAYRNEDVFLRSLEARVDLLLYKPWDSEGLKKTLGRLVAEVGRVRDYSGPRADDGIAFDLGGEGG